MSDECLMKSGSEIRMPPGPQLSPISISGKLPVVLNQVKEYSKNNTLKLSTTFPLRKWKNILFIILQK